MERLLVSGPSLTLAEVAVVASAFAFLLLVPLLSRFAENRRQRHALPAGSPLAERKPLERDAGLVEQTAARVVPDSQSVASLSETLEAGWPTSPPVPSFDPWHPENGSIDGGETPASSSPVSVAAHAGWNSQPESQATPETPRPVEGAAVAATEPVPRPQGASSTEPDQDTAVRACHPWWLAGPPVRTVPRLHPPPAVRDVAGQRCLLEFRRATLPSWPPVELLREETAEDLWQEAEHRLRRFEVRILDWPLALQDEFRSFALVAAESDGKSLRLYLALFPELWPTRPEEATAVAVFDVDPNDGPLAGTVLPLASSG